ncbi:MAG: T9SS type A sorting domain-containing protein [Bacteroidota bacterium]
MLIQTKYLSLLFLILTIIQSISAQNVIYHGSGEEDVANSMVYHNNYYYILGTTRKTDKSATDYYVLKLHTNGSIDKEFVFGDAHRDVGKHIFVDDSGIYVLGKTWDGGFPNNDMYFTRLDFNGKQTWKKYYGSQKNDLGHKFIKTKDGGFAMAGFNRGVDDFGNVYLVKTDKNGEIEWENNFGEKYIDHGFDVAENEANELIIVGTKGGFFNPTTTHFHNHDADIYIIKTNSEGEEIWQKTYGGDGHDWAKKIINAPGGGYYVCGSTQSEGAGSFDFFLMKIDEDGNELWFKTYGGNDFDYGETVQLSADNNLYLYGTSASYSTNYKPDHLLVKTDLDGNFIWLSTYGGEDSDYGTAMVSTPDSGCVITGYTKNGDLGKTDIAFYKLSKNGDPQAVTYIQPVNDSINQIQVFPNPVKKKLSVIIDAKNDNIFDFIMFNTSGSLVYKKSINSNVLNSIQFNLTPGLYIYSVRDNNKNIAGGKLVVR